MATLTKTGQDARDSLIGGVDEVTNIVKTTLGSKGRNVAIDRRWSQPLILNDGVTIASAIIPKDPFNNMGAELVKEAAQKTVDACGDGTTTSLLLAQSIIQLGNEAVKKGSNPIVLKRGIEKAVKAVVEELKKTSHKINSDEEMEQVATISANSTELGKIIAEAWKKVGTSGVIAVEEGVDDKTKITHKEGMQIDHGMQVGAFATNREKMICEIDNPYLFFADFSLTAADEMVTFLDKFIKTSNSKNIVFITDMVEGSALATLVMNAQGQRGAIKTCAIQAPGIGVKRQELLQDMAILTGGQAALSENNMTLENVPFTALGVCDKVEATKDSTKIIGGHGDPVLIKQRIKLLENQLENEKSDYQKEQLRNRLAKLTNGVVIIETGAYSQTEMKDLKERAIDAVASVKAAMAEGIVPGGGITYLKCREVLGEIMQTTQADEQKGVQIIYESLEKPLRQLLINAGIDKTQAPELPLDGKTGIDLETGKLMNMAENGIVDAVKVERLALENAASVAKQILTCEALVTEIPEDKKSPLEALPQMA